MKLVEIDIKTVKRATGAERLRWAKVVIEQFHSLGFLRCVNIPGFEEESLLRAAKWFHLSHTDEQKFKFTTIRFNPNTKRMYRGYFPIIPNQNSHTECFEIGPWEGDLDEHNKKYADDAMARFIHDPAQWPSFNEEHDMEKEFKQTVRNAFDVYFDTARTLLELIALGLGFEMAEFDKIIKDHASTFRLIHYPPRKDIIPEDCKLKSGEIVSTAEHHDTSIITLLANFNYAGLQVLNEKTGEFESIDCQPGSFVVNVGKMLEHMTRGRLRSTIHRVLDLGEERLSVPFFLEPGIYSDLYEIDTKKRWSEKKYGRWMLDYVKKFVEYKDLPSF